MGTLDSDSQNYPGAHVLFLFLWTFRIRTQANAFGVVAVYNKDGQPDLTNATYFKFKLVEMFRERYYYRLRVSAVVWAPHECPLV